MKEYKRSDFHYLRPDYSRPVFTIDPRQRETMSLKLSEIYGPSAAARTLTEIERLIAVYHAHKTPVMLEWEKTSNDDIFTEKDAVLITYGDLIRDEHTKPLTALSELCSRYFSNMFSTLHILPFFPYSSDRGFAVINFLAVDPNLGTWDDILRLKDRFKLMFDGVFNHISSRSRWFQEFLNQSPEFKNFFTSYSAKSHIRKEEIRKLFRPRTTDVFTEYPTLKGKRKVWTTFGPDQVDLNFKNPQVLIRIIEILLYYVRRGADVIRLDAVTYLWNELGTSGVHHRQTHLIISLFRDILNAAAPRTALITETNVPHEQNISYFGSGRNEAHMVYNFALPPLVLHTFTAENTEKITAWVRSLRNIPLGGAFFNFLDSHDGIGLLGASGILSENEINNLISRTTSNGGLISWKSESDGRSSAYELNITSFSYISPDNAGEDTTTRVNRYLAARSIPLVIAGVPGIYLHGLIASENDVESAKTSSVNRNINRRNLDKKSLFKTLDDNTSIAAMVSCGIRHMLKARQQEPAFHPLAEQEVIDAGPHIFCLARRGRDNSEIITAVNVTGSPRTLSVNAGGTQYLDILSGSTYRIQNGKLQTELAPYQAAWFKSVSE